MSYLQGIDIVYGVDPSKEPSGSIRVIGNKSGDINKGFNGKYVWVVPVYGLFPKYTGISIVIQSHRDVRFLDLSIDAGGDYRYLHFKTDGYHKVGRIELVRSDRRIDFNWVERFGWDGFTSDINEGRHGDYLYIVWMWA